MENKKKSLEPAERSPVRCDGLSRHGEPSYFELQAYVGATKHMGGFETTEELVELCHIDKDTYVLDVGCGVGATACYLAKRYGCKVVGVDLRESMIARSNERVQKEGVADSVEFRVADAQDLPFEDATFDVVLCESVVTFIEDKRRVANEFIRVTRPGGYVGLNEEIWLKPPPAELVKYARHTWDIEPDIPTVEDWTELLQAAGLRDLAVKPLEFNARRESTQLKRYRFGDMFRMLSRTISLYIKNPAFRGYMRERKNMPKDIFEYWGYALFVGRK